MYFMLLMLLLLSDYLQVYTSGKGSSAAGLTASVTRDPSSVSVKLHLYTNLLFGETIRNIFCCGCYFVVEWNWYW